MSVVAGSVIVASVLLIELCVVLVSVTLTSVVTGSPVELLELSVSPSPPPELGHAEDANARPRGMSQFNFMGCLRSNQGVMPGIDAATNPRSNESPFADGSDLSAHAP
jgi:hypothetical protein